ncbi:hypothetical protein IMZ48_48290 [Candidatus Bathyarchaeota archaeon]|nr:hypothetical protein [Candidatus Bathyarchaeota archaeon]
MAMCHSAEGALAAAAWFDSRGDRCRRGGEAPGPAAMSPRVLLLRARMLDGDED